MVWDLSTVLNLILLGQSSGFILTPLRVLPWYSYQKGWRWQPHDIYSHDIYSQQPQQLKFQLLSLHPPSERIPSTLQNSKRSNPRKTFLLAYLKSWLFHSRCWFTQQLLMSIILTFLQNLTLSPRSFLALLWGWLAACGHHQSHGLFTELTVLFLCLTFPWLLLLRTLPGSLSPWATLGCPQSACECVGTSVPPTGGTPPFLFHINTRIHRPLQVFLTTRWNGGYCDQGLPWFLLAERYSAHIIIHPSRSHWRHGNAILA